MDKIKIWLKDGKDLTISADLDELNKQFSDMSPSHWLAFNNDGKTILIVRNENVLAITRERDKR